MSLVGWLIIVVLAAPWLYVWCREVGVSAIVAAYLVPACLYYWAGLTWQTFAWSWALPLTAGLIVLMPLYRLIYVFGSRRINGWSQLTMEVEDDKGHLHYVKRIDQGNYINGGSGSGKTASVNRAYASHAARFNMPTLIHDLKRGELSRVLYPIFKEKGFSYHMFAPYDLERCVRINPIAPGYIPDEASLRARVKSFILAAQGRESSDSTSDFFNNASSSLLEALIWYLKNYNPEYCNLPFVMAIISNPDNLHKQSGKKRIPFGKLEALLRRDPHIFSMASAFFQGAGNVDTTSNILQTLLLALNTINTDAGFFLLSEDDVNLRINGPGKRIALALANDPKNVAAYAPILAMAGDAVMTMMCEEGGLPALALLDEAPELPNSRIQNYIAFFRSLKVCMVYTTQDLSQIQRTQGGQEYNLRTMLSNFGHQFLGRTSSEKTAKYYEGLMPRVKQTERSYSSSSNGSSTSRRKVKKPLYEHSEFYSLETGEFVYFHGKVQRFRFRLHRTQEELPPKVREMDQEQMHEIASRIRQEANEFMNSFN